MLHVLAQAGLPINKSRVLPYAMPVVQSLLERWKKAPDKPLPPLVINSTMKGGFSVGVPSAGDVMTINIDLAKVWAQVA